MYDRALKTMRQYHRLSQAEMADQIGISRSYLNEIERDKKEPSLDILRRYAERFEVPLSSLMLFAERSNELRFDKARIFVADKVLKMLEWIAEDEDLEVGKETSR
ncbi:helix-turn-helix transcriptional regulator [Croceibacterium sp. TMG7-5b_MA50]|uniref:helix-turn-helix domain-containing protein n=1 Tax=Croceibacterium sp. TMG7-5b_MA50 TaxID=3121290 RepID=UPI0032220E96